MAGSSAVRGRLDDQRKSIEHEVTSEATPKESSQVRQFVTAVSQALWSQEHFWTIAAALVAVDIVFTLGILMAVRYTEIDFSTYMQQAALYLKGERNYENITGDTGPCVYPALHLYIYSLLHYATDGGNKVWTAQLIFGLLYISCQVAAIATYKAAKAPPILLTLLIFSKRLHSIFVLRLFNDCWTMLLFYIATYSMCKGYWRIGSTFYSLALGIKMNILLYAPAMAAIYLLALGLQRSIIEAFRVLLIQLLIAMPFFLHNPGSYLRSAFNLSRSFLYKWTVNLRFLDEKTFLDKRVASTLLAFHVVSCLVWFVFRWTPISRFGSTWIRNITSTPTRTAPPSGRFIVATLYTCNLIGITFSRSLHYQFYSWYAQQIPLLVYLSSLPIALKVFIPLAIESAWNTFPSTPLSSLVLLACHLVLLMGLWLAREDEATVCSKQARSHKER